MENSKRKLEFRGGWVTSFLPVIIFLFFCILFFIVFRAFEMHALAMGALLALLISALFVKEDNYERFWDAVYDGVKESVPIVILLLIIGMFAELIKVSNISAGFVWIAANLSIGPGLFTAITFLFVALISTATGSSLGTMFTTFPIFYPAGVLLGSNPAALAAAIVSGGIFGDNLAPISDTTIISASTQSYKNKNGVADIGGSVASRFKYAVIAGSISFVLYLFTGGSSTAGSQPTELLAQATSPISLVMLIPVAIMLLVAIRKQNIYLAITNGLVVGIIIGLLFNIISFQDILYVQEGSPSGFLVDGIGGMMGTAVLVMSVYGIMGVMNRAGALDNIIDLIYNSKLGRTVRGTEIAMMLGITITTVLFGGVTSASMTTFGKIQNELGKRVDLHPYRRANLLDGFANSIAVMVPFLSVFVFVGSQLTMGYDFAPQVGLLDISLYMFHSFLLFIVLMVSVITGLGREYEGLNGEPITKDEYDQLKKSQA